MTRAWPYGIAVVPVSPDEAGPVVRCRCRSVAARRHAPAGPATRSWRRTATRSVRLAVGALLVAILAGPGAADERARVECAQPAIVAGDDEGLRAIYEGIRLGLEKAALPRVCLEPAPPDSPSAWRRFERAWEQRTDAVVFALGDPVVQALRNRLPALAKVFVVQRRAIAGRPLPALPSLGPGQAMVVSQMGAERLGQALRRLHPQARPRVEVAVGAIDASTRDRLDRFVQAMDVQRISKGRPDALLHLRGCGAKFGDAMKRARRLKVPLVCDDRARFGNGATVVCCPDHGQVGRTAADLARRLVAKEPLRQPVRALAGLRVWVDLEAADRAGVSLPLAFLATADRLRPGLRRPSAGPNR